MTAGSSARAVSDSAKLRPCAICETFETRDLFPESKGLARTHPLVQCKLCGLIFQKFERSAAEVVEAHRDDYGKPGRRFTPLLEWGVRLARRSRVRLARRHLPPGGRVLDVGCGRGIFLSLLRECGYEVRGTELSSAANTLQGIPVDIGELREGQYPTGSFDLVCIWHVLEHTREPRSVLRIAWDSLRPGGALLAAVPNFASPEARLGGDGWFHLDLPRHIFHFTPATLARLLRDTGFTIERMRTGQWEMDPFSLLQSAQNRLGWRQNAMYDTLSSNDAVKRDLSLPYRTALFALFPLGMLVALLPSVVLRLIGRAGTLIVIARKPAR